ncbi:hypothetical protein GCM10009737_06650 [Nocardioides lentus]|uniref:Cysteine dioxygenase n=1 Tax=Nocardioides lentus TaxID=338077 RepID=A0ABN2P3R7_9ACTN
MTLAPETRPAAADGSGTLPAAALPPLPGRTLSEPELRAWVTELAARPALWRDHVAHGTGRRHYVSLHRDTDVDVWLLCWDTTDDTGWHDHDTSAGAVVVVDGAVVEQRPRLGGVPASRTVPAGRSFAFGPDHIHRMSGAVDGSVSIHAYSPPLWRMGQYAISPDGVMRRWSVSYADELRPVD